MARKMLIDGEVSQPNEEKAHYDFDLFVIGAGNGGVRASRFSASYGAKVGICELPFHPISSKVIGGVGGAFNFIANKHDVLKVPKESYDNCSEAKPIGNTTTTGPVNMTLNIIGNHYFICTIDSHCQTGQKLAIIVLGTLGGTPPSPSTSTSAPPSTSTSPPTTPTPTSASPRAGSRRRPLRPSS
ncbi:hypothetical protein SO802_005048 [Lithocarpus litseifolius]|uniref:Phytocyanin domain-containing protein n=1 Tax=Lithocarpus litseifolius TaxID=425828 RepID=A0AAW2DLA7_9ROSI